ncbi:MAG: MerR family transcriptional regulator [Chloroflexota bacterium]|nr:MAG: MerR family transcriptional regulator [Chloroflexota bacterium]
MASSLLLLDDDLLDALGVTEAARLVGVSPSTLRLWERQGLVEPSRSPGGARRYDRPTLERLRRIARLRREEGWNAAAIRQLLDESPGPAEAGTTTRPLAEPTGGRLRRPDSAERRPSTGRPGGSSGAQRRARRSAIATTSDLGARLRALRTRRRLTLREVAARSGLSISFLSAVERGLSGISVAALRRTLAACDATLAELTAEPTADPALAGEPVRRTRLVRRDERRIIEAEGGVRIEDLAVEATLLEPQLFVLAPGATSDGTYHHPGEEFMFVLAGRVGVWLDEARVLRARPRRRPHLPVDPPPPVRLPRLERGPPHLGEHSAVLLTAPPPADRLTGRASTGRATRRKPR